MTDGKAEDCALWLCGGQLFHLLAVGWHAGEASAFEAFRFVCTFRDRSGLTGFGVGDRWAPAEACTLSSCLPSERKVTAETG